MGVPPSGSGHSAPHMSELIEELREFEAALDAMPEAYQLRFSEGQQFNCYDLAGNEDEDDPDWFEYTLALGPITGAAFVADIEGKWRADLIETALRFAVNVLRARTTLSTAKDTGS
jgi:hypothetical protein